MELRKAFETFFKYRTFLLAVLILSGIVGYGISLKWPVYYRAQGLLFVNRTVEAKLGERTYYTYEGFYRQQTAERFTDTVVGLLNTETLLSEAGKDLGLNVDSAGLRKLTRAAKVTKEAPQLVKVAVNQSTAQKAQELWQALAREGIARVAELGSDEGESRLLLSQVTPDPLIIAVSPNTLLDTLVALGVGLIFGIFAISLREYLKG